MFKRIITMIMVMAMIGAFAMSASAVCMSENGRPGVIGMEYLDDILYLNDLYLNEEIEIGYTIEMVHVEDYWMVLLEGDADEYEGLSAMGIYDHMPTEDEIDILWANRMTDDEFNDLMEQYGY